METSNILDQEANAPIDNHLRIDPLLSCFECEFDCETDDQLKEHVNALHKKDWCGFSSEEVTVLKSHQKDCNNQKEELARPENVDTATIEV